MSCLTSNISGGPHAHSRNGYLYLEAAFSGSMMDPDQNRCLSSSVATPRNSRRYIYCFTTGRDSLWEQEGCFWRVYNEPRAGFSSRAHLFELIEFCKSRSRPRAVNKGAFRWGVALKFSAPLWKLIWGRTAKCKHITPHTGKWFDENFGSVTRKALVETCKVVFSIYYWKPRDVYYHETNSNENRFFFSDNLFV